MPTLNTVLSVPTTLESTIQNNILKSWRFTKEIYVVEIRYSETIVFVIQSSFTYDSQIYNAMKIYLSLDSTFFSI